MITTSSKGVVTREARDESSTIVRDLGAATTGALINAALAAAPIARGVNVIVADCNDAPANPQPTISIPLQAVGAEIAYLLTGVAGTTFTLQENALAGGMQQFVAPTGGGAEAATNFAGRAADILATNQWTFTGAGVLTLVGNAGTATLVLRKIRPNSTVALSDGWSVVSFNQS